MQQPTPNVWQQDRPRLDVRMVRQNRGEVRAPISRGGPPSPAQPDALPVTKPRRPQVLTLRRARSNRRRQRLASASAPRPRPRSSPSAMISRSAAIASTAGAVPPSGITTRASTRAFGLSSVVSSTWPNYRRRSLFALLAGTAPEAERGMREENRRNQLAPGEPRSPANRVYRCRIFRYEP